MPSSWFRSPGAVFLTTVLAGWATTAHGLTIVAPEYLSPNFDPGMVANTTKTGGLPVDIRANGKVAPQRLTDQTLAAMRDSRLGRATALTSAAATGGKRAVKLVVVFDPATGTGYEEVCGEEQDDMGGKSRDKVMMTLCSDGAPQTSVTASNWGTTDLESDDFRTLVRKAATAVYPSRSGSLRGQGFWDALRRN